MEENMSENFDELGELGDKIKKIIDNNPCRGMHNDLLCLYTIVYYIGNKSFIYICILFMYDVCFI